MATPRDDALWKAADKVLGGFVASLVEQPAAALEAMADNRAWLTGAVRSLLEVAPNPVTAARALAAWETAVINGTVPESKQTPLRSPAAGLPPGDDMFSLLGITRAQKDAVDAIQNYAALLESIDFSFLEDAFPNPLPGFSIASPSSGLPSSGSSPPARKPRDPDDARIDKAIEQITKRLGRFFKELWEFVANASQVSGFDHAFKAGVEIRDDLESLPRRLTIALVISTGAACLDLTTELSTGRETEELIRNVRDKIKEILKGDIKSTTALGMKVEARLQRRFRDNNLPAPKGVASQAPYQVLQNYRFWRFREGELPRGDESDKLSIVSIAHEDGSVRAFYYARKPAEIAQMTEPFLTNGMVEDCVDMRPGFREVWEIKPVRSAVLGVVQEMHYRSTFNLVNALFQDFFEDSTSKFRNIVVGVERFSLPAGTVSGNSGSWDLAKAAFVTIPPPKRGKQQLVLVATIPNDLPGLVIYLIFEIDDETALNEALLAEIAKLLQQLLRDAAKGAQEAIDAAEDRLRSAASALIVAAAALAVILLLPEIAVGDAIAVVGALLARALGVLASAQLSPLGAVSAAEATKLLAQLAGGVFAPLPDGTLPRALLATDRVLLDFPEPNDMSEEDIGRTDLLVGGVLEVKRMPVGRWPALVGLVGACTVIGVAAVVQGIREFPQPGQPNV